MNTETIPAVDSLTPAWLTKILRGAKLITDAEVASFSVEPVGVGMLGESVRINLSYASGDVDAPRSLVGKFPARGEIGRATGGAGLYACEVGFYLGVADLVDIRTPRCHYGAVSGDGTQFILLLEDLSPARPGDQLAGCSTDDAVLAMRQAAGLHAPSWGDKAKELASRIPTIRGSLPPQLEAFTREFVSRYPGAFSDEALEIIASFTASYPAFLAFQPSCTSIQHTDFRLDNMLFDVRGVAGDLAVLDWQTLRVGSGPFDVGYFIGGALHGEIRRGAEQGLIKIYLAEMQNRGIVVSWDDMWRDYRHGVLHGLFTAIAAANLTNRTPRGDQLFLTLARRYADHIRDADALSILS